MLIQGQKDSEEILLDELRIRNVEVEYNVALKAFEKVGEQYSISLNNDEQFTTDYIIGADGSHSVVRQNLDIAYKGFKYDETWYIYDIELDTPLAKDEGHIVLHENGGMILIRLKDNVWRTASNLSNLLEILPKDTTAGKIHWESTFHIHHKVAESLVKGNAVLIGDAAHLHSPVGARGMNLGIEDAHIVSQLIHQNKLDTYDSVRKAYLTKTVNRINTMTTAVASDVPITKFARKNISLLSWIFPIVMPAARRFVLGLNR